MRAAVRGRGLVSCAALLLALGCGAGQPAAPTASDAPSRTPVRTPAAVPTPTASGVTRQSAPAPEPPGLVGDRRNALAFAALDDSEAITVEGRVSASPAWSTSKVLVVAAFLDTTAGGDPDRVSPSNRRLIRAALTGSDADAVRSLRSQITGRPGRAMTAVLRDIGDRTTVAPDSYEGLMPWSVREQVRFMAALGNGEVVSTATSGYLLDTMVPI